MGVLVGSLLIEDCKVVGWMTPGIAAFSYVVFCFCWTLPFDSVAFVVVVISISGEL